MRKAKEISLDRVYGYGVRRVRQTRSFTMWRRGWSRRTSTGLKMCGELRLAFWRRIFARSRRRYAT
jgi:hypothetical protein